MKKKKKKKKKNITQFTLSMIKTWTLLIQTPNLLKSIVTSCNHAKALDLSMGLLLSVHFFYILTQTIVSLLYLV